METWTETFVQCLTAQGWAGTGHENLPGVAREHRCPPRAQSAFPWAAAVDKSRGSGKRCSASAEGPGLRGSQKQGSEV